MLQNINRLLTNAIKQDTRKFSQLKLDHGLNIIIEGNIGSGKSTLLNYLKTIYEKINIFCEPIDKWRNVNGINLFDLMYKSPSRYGFTFQSYVQLTMLQQHDQIKTLTLENKEINFSERSIISARYIFVENLFRKEMLTKLEYHILDDYFKHFVTKDKMNIDLIIYLKSTPELCNQRVLERSRPEEKCLSLDDFAFFHNLHEELFDSDNLKDKLWDIPLLTIDACLSKEKMFKIIDDYLFNNYNEEYKFKAKLN